MRNFFYAVVWIIVYLFLALAPLFVMSIGTERGGREFAREFSVALGFVGLSMMGLQFLLTARIRPVVRPYGIDLVYHFHRQISMVAFLFIFAHPVILIIHNPNLISLLNPFTAPLRVIYGLVSLLFLFLVILLSIKRLDFKINYEVWRTTHGFFAVGALLLAMFHVLGVGYYINTPAKQVLWWFLSLFWIGSLLWVRIIKPLQLLRQPWELESVREETPDTYTLAFKPVGHKGFRFHPGQFAWLTVRNSPYALREHPFSFSSSALKNGSVELTIKELGNFSSTMKTLLPGTRAFLDGPYGVFSIDYHLAPGYVFLAGGVGITPIISMLRTLADRRDGRPLLLFYGAKDEDDLAFREDIDALQERLNLKVFYVLEEAPEGWQGPVGFITTDLLAENLPENRVELVYFVCGPEIMMNVMDANLDSLGIPADHIVSERFNLV